MYRATSACHIDTMESTHQERGPAPKLLQVDAIRRASLDSEDLCQMDSAPMCGRLRRPASLYGPMRLFWSLRRQGLRYTLGTVVKGRGGAVFTPVLARGLGFGKLKN